MRRSGGGGKALAMLAIAAIAAAALFLTRGKWMPRDGKDAEREPSKQEASGGKARGASAHPGKNAPDSAAKSAPRPAAPEVSAEDLAEYLTPGEAEMNQLYAFVEMSPAVAENVQYSQRLAKIPFAYIATNDTVNAAGVRIPVKDEKGEPAIEFATVFFGGAARYCRLVGLAGALEDSGHEGALKALVEVMPKSLCAECSASDAARIATASGAACALADPAVRSKALSISSGMMIGIIAHEAGHHALGHLLGFSEKKNPELSRNQEREADSFASSVMSASSFGGEYVFAGTLLWHYAMAAQSDGDGDDSRRTHPLSRERFENFIRQNPAKAAAMGIGGSNVE